MVKYPKFEKPVEFGATSEGRPIAAPEEIKITEGVVVDLKYEGKLASVRVTKVIKPQKEFEGMIQDFNQTDTQHGELKSGDVVGFTDDDIGHIHKWTERKT